MVSLQMRSALPVVFDADQLSDIPLRLARELPTNVVLPFTLLQSRCFITTSVATEVPRTLGVRAKTDAERVGALAAWFDLVLPSLTVVEMSTDGRFRPELLTIRTIDMTDAPTAALALTLAPCVVLSRDHSLVLSGFAKGHWREVWDALLAIRGAEAYTELSAFAMVSLIRAGLWATQRVAGQLGVGPLVLGGVALLALLHRSELVTDFWARLQSPARAVADHALDIMSQASMALTLMEKLTFEGGADIEDTIARYVALTPEGVTAEEIVIQFEIPNDAVEALLRGWRAFEQSEGRWTLGHSGRRFVELYPS